MAKSAGFLQLHRQVWVAVYSVPPSLRPWFEGKAKLKKSTGESDKVLAEGVAADIFAEWTKKRSKAKQAIKRGEDPVFVEIPYEDSWLFNGEAEAIAEGRDFVPENKSHRLKDHIEAWIKTLIGNTEKTRDMKEADGEIFAARFGTTDKVSKKGVQIWVNEMIAAEAAVATVRRKLSNLRSLWAYLQSLDIVDEEKSPFDKLNLPSSKSTAVKVLPFATEQVVDMASRALKLGDQELFDAITISAYTSARIEEIATLEILHVIDFKDIVLPGTKSDAAPRRLPINDDILPILRRLIGTRKSGYLFADLTSNKYGDRSNALGKRFGRMKTKAGFGRDHVFHSIRKTFANQLWSGGVQKEFVKQMQGHETGDLTIDVYAQDPQRAAKVAAIEILAFPGLPELMKPMEMAA